MAFSKKYLSLLVIPLLLVLFSFASTKKVDAADFHFKGYTLAQDQTVNDDVYVTGDNAQINGVINGDLFVCSQTVSISGTITGDVYIVGSSVTFSGSTYGNMFVTGANVSITGNIKGDLSDIAMTSSIDGQVEKDLLQIANSAILKGSVSDDVRSIANSLSMQALVGGDVLTIDKSETVQKENITGNIYDLEAIKGIAKSQGVDWDTQKENYTAEDTKAISLSAKLIWALISFVGLGLAGYFLVSMSPVKTGKIVNKITGSAEDFIKSLCTGLLIFLLIPLPLFLLFLSIFGVYIGLLVLGILVFILIFGKIWVEVAFGQEILSLFRVKEYRPFKSLLIGRFLTIVISFVPLFGSFYSAILTITALGAFTRMKWEYMRHNKKR